jgi:tRNA threonylcarbamoyladenosine biosynthesis protein TsaB
MELLSTQVTVPAFIASIQISPIMSVMNFLLLDTADSRGCVALFRDLDLLAVDPHQGDEDFSTWLLPAANRLLCQNRLSLADLDGYAVCSGPGSFTGLRVGLTTVKAWVEIYNKPIAAVSRLEALAAADTGSARLGAAFTAAFLDARRGQVFAALYDHTLAAVEPETVIGLETFLSKADTRCNSVSILWKTPDPNLLEAVPLWPARQDKGDLLERIDPPFAVQLGRRAHERFLQGQTTDALTLDANYVRRSDAELFWKDHVSAVRA